MLRSNRKHTDLGGKDELMIIGNIITGRTKSVTVKHRSHNIAIAEQNGRRTIPRLHHCCIIIIEIFLFLGHGTVIHPRLRNGNHHGQRKRHTAHDQKFQCIIQHCGIGTGRINHRKYLI